MPSDSTHFAWQGGEEPTSFNSAGLCSKEKLQIDSEWQGLLITNRGFTRNRVLSTATVPRDNALDCCQSDARTFKVFSTVQTLKHFEQLFRILLPKSDTVVADVDDRGAVLLPLSALDDGSQSKPREFDGFGQ